MASSRAQAGSLGSRQAGRRAAGKGHNIPGSDAFTDTGKLRFHSTVEVTEALNGGPVNPSRLPDMTSDEKKRKKEKKQNT